MTKATGANGWRLVLALDDERKRTTGSEDELVSAIRHGADLRIYTEFRHNEHVDTSSSNREIVQELVDFRVTYLLEDRWAAGIMSLRQPVELPVGFGPRPSMSFFLYNQNGLQAIARPYLDQQPATGVLGPAAPGDYSDMPKYHQLDNWDAGTNAPSQNFIYDFETFRFFVRDDWREVLAHSSDGTILSGSLDALTDAFSKGAEIKLGIRGLCTDLHHDPADAVDHEVFVQSGSNYYYTEQSLFVTASHPVVRVKPAVPLRYESRGWDAGWLVARTNGCVARWLVDPYTLEFAKSEARYDLRWFVR